MERGMFLIEDSGRQIGCLLNPETVTIGRTAGVRPRESGARRLTGRTLMDDPLMFTGGGRTELDLDLLFDVTISERAGELYEDVRELTRPLMMLAENTLEVRGVRRPPLIRFFWGLAWNFPGVIVAAAERFDLFTAGGVPRRSWLKLKMLRVADPDEEIFREFPEPPPPVSAIDLDAEPAGVLTTTGDGARTEGFSGVRPDTAASQALGNPLAWRLLAVYNDLDDPFAVDPGTPLRVPAIEPGGPAE